MMLFKKGDTAIYKGIEAKILDIDCEQGKEHATTYKIEIYTNCQQRFWVHNKELTTTTSNQIKY